jgi:hypothetical protein
MLSRGTFWKRAASSPDLNAAVKVEEKQGVTSDVFPRGISSMQVPAVLDSECEFRHEFPSRSFAPCLASASRTRTLSLKNSEMAVRNFEKERTPWRKDINEVG